jgi:hypothetical protein
MGLAMTPTHTRKRGRLYRYYVSTSVIKAGPDACPIKRVPAAKIETLVINQIRVLLQSPEIIVATWRTAKAQDPSIKEADVRNALLEFDPLWNELFPAEQARIVRLLIERVDVGTDHTEIRMRTEGVASLVSELRIRDRPEAA